MHRIDSSGAIAGQFNDDQGVQSPTTRMSAAWANDIQENVCEVIEAAAIGLVKGDATQLLAAIQVLIDRGRHRTGEVIKVFGTTVWDGYLKFDGVPRLKASYPALVTYLTAQDLLVDGETGAYFVLPDARGYADRNWDDGAGVDPGRAIGTLQEDAFPAHSHSIPSNSANGTANGFVEDTDGGGTPRSAETGSAGTGTETRVKNIALMYLIKT